ncbi:SIMPL domain-containing protein [Candidatus Microgenomates bacterium]|nr:SIMPL domain-containing protein [Candidatus Microgenomates bacterium]
MIKKVKEFGIEDKDIQTQNVGVYETSKEVETMIYPAPPRPDAGTQKTWQATNSITIKLKDVSKSQALTDLLQSSGATNTQGPSFGLEDANKSSDELMIEAINDAKEKAEKIAKASGRRLGKIITVSEGGGYPIAYPMALEAKGADRNVTSAPVEPGTQTVYKSVSVLFELR